MAFADDPKGNAHTKPTKSLLSTYLAGCYFVGTMSQSNDSSNPEEKEHDLESIFQQKRILRSQVRKTLKFMDPSLRSHEGQHLLSLRSHLIIIFLYLMLVEDILHSL